MASRFHHMALAVKDIEAATASLIVSGFKPSEEFEDTTDEALGVKARFLSFGEDGPVLELVQGLTEESPITNILEKNGPMLYHMCLEVDDLSLAGENLKNGGYRALGKASNAKAYSGRKIQFFYHSDSGLIELLEKEKP